MVTGWELLAGNEIANEYYRLTVDPARGGAVSSLRSTSGRELSPTTGWATSWPSTTSTRHIRESGEGPWHLVPKGPVTCSSAYQADSVQVYRGPLGRADRGARPDR